MSASLRGFLPLKNNDVKFKGRHCRSSYLECKDEALIERRATPIERSFERNAYDVMLFDS